MELVSHVDYPAHTRPHLPTLPKLRRTTKNDLETVGRQGEEQTRKSSLPFPLPPPKQKQQAYSVLSISTKLHTSPLPFVCVSLLSCNKLLFISCSSRSGPAILSQKLFQRAYYYIKLQPSFPLGVHQPIVSTLSSSLRTATRFRNTFTPLLL